MQKMPNNTNINVDVRTGAFEYHAVDLVLPAPGLELRFERWHSSTSSLSMQDGWRFDWDERLEFDSDGSVRHYRGQDVMSRFVENVDGTFSPAAAWVHSSLERVGERFLLELPNLDKHAFNASHGRLLSREDAHGNRMTFTWLDPFRLERIEDASGRRVEFTWTELDEGSRMTATDWTGRELVYEFGPSSAVEAYTDPEGNTTRYAFNSTHRFIGIETITLPDGTVFVTNIPVSDMTPLGTKVARQVFANGRERVFTYSTDPEDPSRRMTRVDDGGRVTTYFWSSTTGHVVEKRDPLGNVWTYDYDPVTDDLLTITEPNLATVEMTYDSRGNMLTRQNQKGRVWTYEYHPVLDKVTKITGPAPFSYITEFTYDPDTGDLLTRKDPLLKTTTYEYHPDGKLKKVTPPGSSPNVTEFTYDLHGHLTQVKNGLNKTWSFEYDETGNQVAAVDPLGRRTTREFDRLNRVILTRSPLGHTTRMRYDANGNLITVTDPLNRGTQFEYSAMGDLLRVVDPAGGSVSYAYDLHHNLTEQVDPNGHVYSFEYDVLDRQTKVVDPMGQVTVSRHDPFCGSPVVTDAEGVATSLSRDVTCLPTERSFPDTSTFSFEYDEEQRRTRSRQPQALKFGEFAYGSQKYGWDAADDTTFTWDGNHRMTEVAYPGSKSIDFAWDDAGRLSSLTDIHGTSIAYGYDAANRLTSVTRATKVTNYGYDDANRLTLLTYPNGVTCDFTYDDDSRVTRMLWKKGVDTLYDILYRYDAAGNRTQRSVTVPPASAVVEDFNYDALSRLVRVTEDGSLRNQYRFDPAGNRLLKKSSTSEEFSDHDASDELVATNATRFRWDRVGQLVEKDDPAEANPTRYAWNYAHRLRKVTLPDLSAAQYRYNADELRTWRKEPSGAVTSYYWVPEGILGLSQVLNELDGAGAQKANYVLGPNGLIAIIDGSGNERYYVFDALGSVLALTDETGTVTDTYTYDEYGIQLSQSGSSGNQFGFTGEALDPESGFYYLRDRFMSPQWGRFISRDRLFSQGGRYFYANNNPELLVDPTGLSSKAVCLGCLIAAGLLTIDGVVVAGSMLEQLNACLEEAWDKCKGDWQDYDRRAKWCHDKYGLIAITKTLGLSGIADVAFYMCAAAACAFPSP